MRTVMTDTPALEWHDTLQYLKELNATYKELDYFLELGRQRDRDEHQGGYQPRVIVLGHSFPDEIIRAMGEVPYYLLGGSLDAANQAESMVPRDTDAATKSILGILTNEETQFAQRAIILIPLVSDSMRKLRDMLADRYKVVAFEVPCDRDDPLQQARWHDEIARVTVAVERHLLRYMTAGALRRECQLTSDAVDAWKGFWHEHGTSLSGSAKLFVANSYHWCKDKAAWAEHLNALTAEMKTHKQLVPTKGTHLRVMLLGSPIYAPNYKVPFLIEEMGLENYSIIHPDLKHLSLMDAVEGSRYQLLCMLADRQLRTDMSTAFVQNAFRLEEIRRSLETGRIHGIVMHILKGQIEYDFELNELERMVEEYQVPVFRLETDYNYQDVEQLRIRLEAFAEMLRHRAKIQREETYVKKAI